ncbi:MAG: hypothetical protein ABIG40_00240 [Parcubacteria group bacterium]
METIQQIKEAENQIENALGRARKEAEGKIESAEENFKKRIENVDLGLKDQVSLVLKNAQEKATEMKTEKEKETQEILNDLNLRVRQKINGAISIVLKELLK